ncbi:hypothetical protein [Acidocella sp.]|uniref:DUF4376 domain-containing protein n=1 Tax=Acidocella sp. TaxID=50710 RepID=UPI00261E7795|nr:hypothetical protein [Acidocella sp.]
MTVYAQYNPSVASPQMVEGYFDTETPNFKALPATGPTLALYQLTATDEGARFVGVWGMVNGVFTEISLSAAAPTLAQQAQAALNAGLAITSSGTPALSATYACNEAAQARLNRVSVYLQVNGAFPNNATTIQWVDATGAPHTFTEAQFKSLAVAIADYVLALDDVALGLASTLPATTATIP